VVGLSPLTPQAILQPNGSAFGVAPQLPAGAPPAAFPAPLESEEPEEPPLEADDPPFDFEPEEPPFDVGDPPFDVGDPPFDVGDPPFDVEDPPFDVGNPPLDFEVLPTPEEPPLDVEVLATPDDPAVDDPLPDPPFASDCVPGPPAEEPQATALTEAAIKPPQNRTAVPCFALDRCIILLPSLRKVDGARMTRSGCVFARPDLEIQWLGRAARWKLRS
jgi:hypothetical protein